MRMKRREHLTRLLKAYLENRCTEAEFAELLDLVEQARHDEDVKQILESYWDELSDHPKYYRESTPEDQNLWFEEIHMEARMRGGQANRPQPAHRRTRHRSGTLLRVAAILVLALSLSLAWLTLNPVSADREASELDVAMIEKRAERGEKVRFNLPDGTQVHLNSDSRLRFESTFGDSLREVYLEGEGYFVVSRNEQKPFLVHANGIRTRVLGTAFNVRSHREERGAVVAVTHGRVAVAESSGKDGESSDLEAVVLQAGEWADYNIDLDLMLLGEGDLSEWTAWNEGVLLYHDKKLADVANELERWYGVTIEFGNEALGECVIRGEHRDEVLENVLNAIGYAFDIDYRIEGRHVTLTGEGCESKNR